MTNQQTATNVKIWALLIGIDDYQAVNKLRGCANDVEAMRIFLINQLGVPEVQIRVLTDRQATRAAILQAFQDFLINNPSILHSDQILIHYSGHGSQMQDVTGLEPDGMDETIVPQDSRTPGVFDIPDKTLAALLAQLAQAKGDNITIVLDSCHSGSGTRMVEEPGTPLVRQIPADERTPPATLDAGLRPPSATRSIGPSAWLPGGEPYVLIAGCRDRELSNEYAGKDEQQGIIWHGAMTYFLLQTMRSVAPDTSYAELIERVATQVNGIYPTQTPQCEGDRTRVVFGGVRVQLDPFITVQKVDQNGITLGAGLVHGLRQGTRLAVYAPDVHTKKQLPAKPLATVVVTSVTATTAQAKIEGTPTTQIVPDSHALVIAQVYTGLRQTVALQAKSGDENSQAINRLHQALQPDANSHNPSPYLALQTDPTQPAQLQVVADGGKYSIYSTDGKLLVMPEDIQAGDTNDTGVQDVIHALESIVRFRSLLELTNNQASSRLAGRIKINLRHYVANGQPEALPAGATGPGGELTVSFDPDNPDASLYVIDVTNQSSLPVYPYIFTMSPDYSIHLLYPALGQQEAIAPGNTLHAGLESAEERLRFYLPDGWDTSRDYIKIIVTTTPSDLSILQQDPLQVPPPQRGVARGNSLEQLVTAVAAGSGMRFVGTAKPVSQDDWTTVELPITTVRTSRQVALNAPAERVELGDGIALVKPEGFAGTVSVATLGQATRGIGSTPTLKLPPGIERFSQFFQPLQRTGTRSAAGGSNALVLTFAVDEQSRQAITQHNPLRLELPQGELAGATDLLAITYDGEDYLLSGYRDKLANIVSVVALPAPVTPTGDEEITTRDVTRTIKLFIFKQMGRYTPETGLHRGSLDDQGNIVYDSVKPDQFKSGDKVALFVHGFSSDTGWMIKEPAQFFRQTIGYDHVLAWDYESYGTGVRDNGEQLALALKQQCGFGPDDGITVHVFAHSLGCLVTRAMVELAGGAAFIDRVILGGPPNRGTTLASLEQGGVYLLTGLINKASAIPPVGAANWLVQQVFQKGLGPADLAVDSPVEKQLNSLDKPDNVPYLILAGNNSQDDAEQNIFQRLAQKVLRQSLESLFGEANDAVIGMSSMRGMRNGAYPHLTIQAMPFDHFHYFLTAEDRELIRKWITG